MSEIAPKDEDLTPATTEADAEELDVVAHEADSAGCIINNSNEL